MLLPDFDSINDELFPGVTGSSPALLEAMEKAAKLARCQVPILLLGETGVGKEVFARGIHTRSQHGQGPFIALNCGGLNRDLLASELFGHVDGAFTGARRGGIAGKIEAAEGGTLFLDELGEMPLDLQPHFLRVLEDGHICRVGETRPRKVNFRLVAATNRDLRGDVAAGRFRMDLYYRISVTSIPIPPLRERGGDIRELANQFLVQFCRRYGSHGKALDSEVLAIFRRYPWPGNVRELRNVIEALVLTAPGSVVRPEDLPAEFASNGAVMEKGPASGSREALSGLERSEFQQICSVLQKTAGNATLAAKHLGIAKSTLYLKLKKYELDETLHLWRAGQAGGDAH